MMVDIANAFVMPANTQIVIGLIRSRLKTICLEPKLKFKAQNMARICFDKFVKTAFIYK